ncbi:hypothetical protein BDV11DRAFT_199699 [Aspergillus similis]
MDMSLPRACESRRSGYCCELCAEARLPRSRCSLAWLPTLVILSNGVNIHTIHWREQLGLNREILPCELFAQRGRASTARPT